ncbi:hypothetical protein [Motilibacter aurantiacus]|uniref:hypothetical protein n=1 Tax=Motilibacter aurantiacus TaxID=2714955 RepID=UPI00140AF638|nr:hypothetical protein [Motilibacter aurantiacus]NHC46425.1 hypothetical protein [Motilibacter aurantiacus]
MAARLPSTTPGAARTRPAPQPLQRLTDRLIAGELGRVRAVLLCVVSPTARRCRRLWQEAEQAAARQETAVASAAVARAARRWSAQTEVDAEFWRIVAAA